MYHKEILLPIEERVGIDKLVSIIMPAYNAEKYISDAIESVLIQSYDKFELIIVNDASQDNTEKIVSTYLHDDRIYLINHKTNMGAAQARNTAIDNAKGRYIAFLDADDIWHSGKLALQIDFMVKNNVGFTFTAYSTFNDLNQNVDICTFSVPKSIDYNHFLRNTIIGNLTVVLDRWIVRNVHIQEGPLEDTLTWMYFLRQGYIAYGINENLARYRVYMSSKSGNKVKNAKKHFECLKIYQKLPLFKAIYCELGYIWHATYKRLIGRIKKRVFNV